MTLSQQKRVTNNVSGLTNGTAGISKVLVGSNQRRMYLLVQNVSGNNLWLNFGAVANLGQPSILLTPNSWFVMENNEIDTRLISITSAGSGSQPYFAIEMSE